jgi:adenosine deaminase
VVGFDIAGDEANFPILLHREPLLYARAAGYGMTAHAGEGAGAQSVRDAIDGIGVSRIGHGARSGEEPRLLVDLRDRGITLEMCPTSNVQTHAVPSLVQHPLARFYLAGVRVTVSTDGRTVSDTTLTRELVLSNDVLGVRVRDIAAMTLVAVQDGFAEQVERRALLREMARDMLALGIGLPPS